VRRRLRRKIFVLVLIGRRRQKRLGHRLRRLVGAVAALLNVWSRVWK
jgi:hypothetical protein